jgi:hypothetical protein
MSRPIYCAHEHRPGGSSVSDEIVVLREYGNEMEAQFAATVLEANGVPARVVADTAGGALPSMALVFPVRLLVRALDADLARELLDTPADQPPDDSIT